MTAKKTVSALLLSIASLNLLTTPALTLAEEVAGQVVSTPLLEVAEQEVSQTPPQTDPTSETAAESAIADSTTTQDTSKLPLALLDDSRVQSWMGNHQFQATQTLFRTDVEGKVIHDNVSGYQAPLDLAGYTYLSSVATTTETGPGLVHIYRDVSYIDKAIVRTEYIDGTSGKKLQDDAKGQVFVGEIGQRKYYDGLVVDINGEKVYKIFYLSDEEYVAYAGSKYYVRLTDYTSFIDQATGQEIAQRQAGFIPVYDVTGYAFVSGEIVEKDGYSYFVQSFKKLGESGDVSVSQNVAQTDAVTTKEEATASQKPGKTGLPSTGEVISKAGYVGLALLAVLGIVGLLNRKKK